MTACLAALVLIFVSGTPHVLARQAVGIAEPALNLVNDLSVEARSGFYVYFDSDSGLNHGFFSGWFPEESVSRIHLNTACVYSSTSPTGCTTDQTASDAQRGTVVMMGFDPQPPLGIAGINVEDPENYGVNQRGFGYDLRGATRVCFDIAGPASNPANFQVQLLVAQKATAFISVPKQWTEQCYEFNNLGLTQGDLANVHFPFTVVTNDTHAASGGRILLDRIRFEPVPTAQQGVMSFPRANTVLGVIPTASVLPGRVKIPPDQALANLSTAYESAMGVLVLLGSGRASDVASAKLISDAFVYAIGHDNHGDPLPAAPDGSTGLHSAFFSGDLVIYNDQGVGQGQRGDVRLAGFHIASNECGPVHFCLVLDGATGGNAAFAMMALEAAYQRFGDQGYLDAARTIGRWIFGSLRDTSVAGFGGYFVGYTDDGTRTLIKGKSIENNADIYLSMNSLAQITRGLGLTAEADLWAARAKFAGDFVMQLFDSKAGRFYAGTVPVGLPPSPGITPNGPQKGSEVVNTAEFIDAQTFVILPMAASQLYRNSIDWRRPVSYLISRFAATVFAANRNFSGFNLVPGSTEGPSGIAYEFTAQAVAAMRFVDMLYGEVTFEATAQFYLGEIQKAQQFAPFTDHRGLVAAVLQNGDQLPPYEHCLTTPFQCIATRVGLAATTWAIAADLKLNPFLVPSTPPTSSCTTPDPFTSIGGGTCVNGGWIPGGGTPTPTPPTTPPPTAPPPTGGCTTPDPFTSIGGGTCVNGGWIPGGGTPTPTPPTTPPPTAPPPTGGCATPDPFTSIGGGTCVNGGWIPGGGTPTPTPPTTPPPTAPPPTGGCTTPDPFTSIGGGTCVNGGWIPGGGTPTPTPPTTPPPSGGCTTPDPFTSIGGGTCVNGGWIPRK